LPAYNGSPFAPPAALLLSGENVYFFGFKVGVQPTTRMQVTSVSANGTNNATVGVKILEGPIPIVGNLISITGTTSAAGAYNVTNVALTNVVIDATSGIGTVTFNLTTAQLAVTADFGTALVPIAEVAEALVNGASKQFATQQVTGSNENAATVTWSTLYPSQPGSVTMQLQAAMVDLDAQYNTVDTSTNVAGEERFVTLTNFSFLRVKASNVTGTAPTVIVKMTI
jgi:hypothetical protein